MRHSTIHSDRGSSALACALLALVSLTGAGCGGGSSGGDSTPATVPDFGAATFSDPTTIDHPYFPLVPGTTTTFVVGDDDDKETIVVEVLATTRVVSGVECVVVRDRGYEGGLLMEDTRDWYAQDDEGNVWYMGEESVSYEYDDEGNQIDSNDEGSWEAGEDVADTGRNAKPGHIMRAQPAVGDLYHQEYYQGEAEDTGEVIASTVPISLADGRTLACLQVRDSSTLAGSGGEYKYYASGIGLVKEEREDGSSPGELRGSFLTVEDSVPDFQSAVFSDPTRVDNGFHPWRAEQAAVYIAEGEEGFETTVIEVEPTTRTVAGIECLAVRDRVYVEELLLEDTEDWYAQDDAGNVWYMGEESVSYEYDEEGNQVDSDDEGSWEAGEDSADTGEEARPGIVMQAMPTAGQSYYQEFYRGEAEDMGYVVALTVELELQDGGLLEGCLQTLDWNPLEPDALEYKYYAPGIGLVREQDLHDGASGELRAVYDRSATARPDFGLATFSSSTTIDNPFLPLAPGTIFRYEGETEDGTEVTTVSVLASTKVILGVACVVVQDQVELDGLLIEDTFDWYCQDDAGNVWYMGEDVTNYEYDEDGNLVGSDEDGSWEAGMDSAGTGSLAEPGFAMPAAAAVGESYAQEYYEGEAEDMGYVAASGRSVELADGSTYEDCLVILDWNPLQPGALEAKSYAPGIGLVLEEALHTGERVELVDLMH